MRHGEGEAGEAGRWRLFANLPPEVSRTFLVAAVRRRYAKGEVIFHEGDPGDAMHLIDRGNVVVRITNPLGDVATLSVRGPGDFFGDLGFINPEEYRSATVVALSSVETLVLQRGEMDRLVAEHPQVLWVMVEMLAERVRALSALVLESRYDTADVRVRRRLLECSYEDDEKSVVEVTQEELAWLAGTTRGTVNRVLAEEVKRGTLTTARGRITVVNRSDLERRAK
jgi:CRP/FNR family transcriptional regulator, cyclic AMP receptor protein